MEIPKRTRATALISLLVVASISLLVAGEDVLAEKTDSRSTPATILSRKVICKQAGRYIAWPTGTKTSSGDLLAVFSGDRDAHLCPRGKTFLVRSTDGGKSWSEPLRKPSRKRCRRQ